MKRLWTETVGCIGFRCGKAEAETILPRRASAAAPLLPWLVLVPLLFYIAGLNPFLIPASYDDIVYYSGAASLAEDGTFKFLGQHIVDWPPGTSVLLAVPFALGTPSVLVAKICIVLCAATGLILALRLFRREQRPLPELTLILFALLPSSLLMGTRIMSEWPYFLASMLFLLALRNLGGAARGLLAAVIAGVILGIASLTKFTGVLLGAAVIAQAIAKARQKGSIRAAWPEAITACIGASLFLLWKAKIQWQINRGIASDYEYYHGGWAPVSLGMFDPFSLPGLIGDLFFHTEGIMNVLGWHGPLALLVCAIPGTVVLIGMAARLCSRERSASDWYVLSLLILLGSVVANQQTRYVLPVAPFLIGYGFLGFRRIAEWLRFRSPSLNLQAFRAATAAWLLLLVSASLHLLLVGNLNGTHRGLCPLVSRTPETFYRGFWLDLYEACQRIKTDPAPGNLAIMGDEDKYVTAFSGRHRVTFDPFADFAFLLVLNGTDLPREQRDALHLLCLKRCESLVLYKRETAAAGIATRTAPPVRREFGKATETHPQKVIYARP